MFPFVFLSAALVKKVDHRPSSRTLLVVDIVMGAIVSILERNHSLDHFILGGDHLPLLSLAREPIHRGIRRRLKRTDWEAFNNI